MPSPRPPRQGIIAALWVPADRNRRLMKRALASHLGFLRERGVDGVLALGSTGEFPRFDHGERERILAATVELAGALPVLANISSIRLDEVVALGRFARSLGVAGATLMPPSFYPMAQADMRDFFLRAADAVDLPFYLYNFPELTGNRIGLETVAAFAERAPMAGIKQSGAEFAYHRPLIRLGREKNFVVFSGADTRLPEVFALGGAGCIGGLVNFVPEPMVEIYRACRGDPPRGCGRDAARMRRVGRMIDRVSFPLNVAAGIEARGLDPGTPKTVLSKESARLYRDLVADLRSAFKSWELR